MLNVLRLIVPCIAGFSLLMMPGLASAQFEFGADDFGFENYTNESMPLNLTADEMQALFGPMVCAEGSGESCVLTPPAERWMEQTSDSMGGGHCEGMAVQSLRFWIGEDDPSEYGGELPAELQLADNEFLQREIGLWWATQAIDEVADREIRMSPMALVALLETSFESEGETYTLGFYKRDMTGGHAVLPVDVVDLEDGSVGIVVYDNNYPGEERIIAVDPDTDSWQYVASTSPDVPGSEYEGDASTRTLTLTPLSIRTGPHACSFCGSFTRGMPSTRSVRTSGEASILIEQSGGQIGHRMDGTFVDSLDGAEYSASRSDDLWQDRAEPTYRIPGGGAFDILATGVSDGPSETDISIVGQGYYLGVEYLLLEPGQTDLIQVGADTASLVYETEGYETADVVVGLETGGADWLVIVRSRGDSAGQVISAEVDLDAGGLLFRFDSDSSESLIDLYVSKIDGSGELEFGSEDVTVQNGVPFLLRFTDFDSEGEALPLEADEDGDGTYEMMEMLADEGGLSMAPTPTPGGENPPSGVDAGPGSDGGTGADAGPGSDGGVDPVDDGGCGCTTPGRGPSPAAWFLGLVLFAGFSRRRR